MPTLDRKSSNSTQNLTEFDHDLDNLLEDLQNSVARPGSSTGTYKNKSQTLNSYSTNSFNRRDNNKSSKPVEEYFSDDAYNYTSPDGTKQVTGYKKESYLYKTGGIATEKVRVQKSINQLDSLLDDLQVSNNAFEEKESYNIGKDPDTYGNTRRSAKRELNYEEIQRSTPRTRSSSRNRDLQYTNEAILRDLEQSGATSPSALSKTSTLSKQTKVTNVHNYPMEIVETITSDSDLNPQILSHLDPNIQPLGNTKVTTTIKTYTYEIPASANYPSKFDTSTDSEHTVYSPNQSQSTPSKSFVYKKTDNSSSENTINYLPARQNKIYKEVTTDHVTNQINQQPYQKPAPPIGHTLVKETVTTRNYQPGYSPDLGETRNRAYIYNENTTTKNIDNSYLDKQQNYPPRQETYIYDRNTTNNVTHRYPDSDRGYPTHTIIKEVHHSNTNTNTNNNKVPPHTPNGHTPGDTVVYKHESHTSNHYGSVPKDVETFEPRQSAPVNIQYRHKSETTNNYKSGYPPRDETQTLLPNRFPTTDNADSAPKKLDVLMANIGNEPQNSPYNARFNDHEQEVQQQRKIDSLKRVREDSDEANKNIAVPKSKNVSGPPVYYPPGHEMFASKEEGGGEWRAQGGYQKASGKYEYEAGSRSKSKSSSGAAIVPVCLPLCCGLPCTII